MPTALARTQRALSVGTILRPQKKRRRVKKRLPRQQLPKGVVLEYYRALKTVVDLTEESLAPLFKALPDLMQRSKDARERLDAGEGREIRALVEAARRRLGAQLSTDDMERLALKFSERTKTWQRLQLSKQVKAVFGIDVINTDPRMATIVDGFIAENVALIKDIPDKIIKDVEGTITRAVSTGRLHSDIAKDLTEKFGIGKRRAKFIARDQVNKLYGQLNVSRQKSLGVTRFTWRDSGDERVRDLHQAYNGNVYSYDNPPADGLPGEAIGCRCSAEPVLEDILES